MSAPAGASGPVPLEIRPMSRHHLARVLDIEAGAYPRPWSRATFLSELGQPASRAYFIGKVDREIAGFAGLMLAGEDAHITTVTVAEEFRRRGIGRNLLLAVVDEAIRRGATGITLEVAESNVGAQQLYSQFGFRPHGVRKRYYEETGEDAVIMWVTDASSDRYGRLLDGLRAGDTATRGRHRWQRAIS